jgi:hypothetical protein
MKGMQTAIMAAHPNTRIGEIRQAGSTQAPAIPPVRIAVVWRSIVNRCGLLRHPSTLPGTVAAQGLTVG